MPIKVFCIGAHKNATTTLEAALIRLGINMCPQIEVAYKHLGADIDHSEEALQLTDIYDGFQDSPWNHLDFYKKLYQRHPDAYFILTSRPANEWYESYVRFIEKGWKQWSRFTYRHLFERVYEYPCLPENREKLEQNYVTRNTQIREFFANKPDAKFLDVQISELNYPLLCNFLGIEKIHDDEFPRVNVSK